MVLGNITLLPHGLAQRVPHAFINLRSWPRNR